MLEVLFIISNGVVVVAIGALYVKINSYGKDLNDHKVYIAEEITKRPNFDKMDEKICGKLKPVKESLTKVELDFKHHVHEGSTAKVVL